MENNKKDTEICFVKHGGLFITGFLSQPSLAMSERLLLILGYYWFIKSDIFWQAVIVSTKPHRSQKVKRSKSKCVVKTFAGKFTPHLPVYLVWSLTASIGHLTAFFCSFCLVFAAAWCLSHLPEGWGSVGQGLPVNHKQKCLGSAVEFSVCYQCACQYPAI